MNDNIVGRILRASTRGFDCGTHSRNIGPRHDFGAFVKAPIANRSDVYAIGLIYKVEIQDDQLIAELVLGESVPESILRDQRENRMVPVEVKVLSVGYVAEGQVVHSLPPRPPMSLSDVELCSAEEVNYFAQRLDFFRIVLGASEVPSDDLLAAAIHQIGMTHIDAQSQYQFYVAAGQRVARELSGDLKRLSHLLALINPLRA